jgi:hypothetical protein
VRSITQLASQGARADKFPDGGGVRGMSTIAILRELMKRLAKKRKVNVVHPWEEFDMIGGTSTVRIPYSACTTITIRPRH